LGHVVLGQLTITGTVYDSTKTIPVSDVLVRTGPGASAITDSSGHYSILAGQQDSLTFIYNNKPTLKFPVKLIPDPGNFDISIHVRVREKFQTMKEVKVYTRTFRQDSIENREHYKKIFNYDKPGLASSMNAGTGTVGMDVDQLINIFRFRRNRQLQKLQDRLVEQEQENYIRYRFNKTTVKRITRLEGAELDKFMVLYRPDFEFTESASTVDFYQYILTSSYMFKKGLQAGKPGAANP
jgi:hypothetical protein